MWRRGQEGRGRKKVKFDPILHAHLLRYLRTYNQIQFIILCSTVYFSKNFIKIHSQLLTDREKNNVEDDSDFCFAKVTINEPASRYSEVSMPDDDETFSLVETVLAQLLGFSARKSRRSTPGGRRHRRSRGRCRSSTWTSRSSAASTVLRSPRPRSCLLSAAVATHRGRLLGRRSRRDRIHVL